MDRHSSQPATLAAIDDALLTEVVDLVRSWLRASAAEPTDASAARLAGVLEDPNGLAFTVGFVDGVIRPEDTRAAARNLAGLVPILPRFLPLPLRAAVRAGAQVGRVQPDVVVGVARRVLRTMVRHLIVDASEQKLGPALRRIRAAQPDSRLNINLLGEAILGQEEAARRLSGTRALLEREDVDYVSIKVSSTVAPHSHWSFEEAVADAVDSLAPLYRLAAGGGQSGRVNGAKASNAKFINLDMEEYKDLDLTMAVFTTLLDREEFRHLEAGIVLQAYLPDALAAMMRLQEWAARRVAAGGAPIKVRVVKGANLPMERVDAEMHGWPLATWESKQASDASYKAVLDYALRPEHIEAVRVGVAGHNLFDIAMAWLLAQRRGVAHGIEVEMLLGMAPAQAAAVRKDVGSLLLYTPVVHPEEFDVAIAYLIRRLEEGASAENFMSAVFDLDSDEALFERERRRFLASVRDMPTSPPAPRRVQDRTRPPGPAPRDAFRNTPDTDPAVAANRAWAAAIRQRAQRSQLGRDLVAQHTVTDAAALTEQIERARAGALSWRERDLAERIDILHRAGDVLEQRRADLLEVMASECGKLLDQGDPEVSEAIDFAHYYAGLAAELRQVDGAEFTPDRLTLVTPPWNFPVAIPAGSTLAALAAGSAVLLKPAPQAARCSAVLAQALWDAGVPRDALIYLNVDEATLGSTLIGHPGVDRVVLTGAYETAELFRGIRHDLPLLAETSGKNAIIVTPSADLDLAARDVAASAFGHAGQKCSAASLVVLVGSVATSPRFRRQLLDAVTSLHVGLPWDERAQVGPLTSPATGKLHEALTQLEPGQSWLVAPEQLDEEGLLWRPGIRDGVQPGSAFHLTEYFGPVLGVMTAATLEEAIELVNRVDYGLTSGLHSLDETEIATWLASVQAGNLYVNRGTTGAIVQRQPFGGWKRSAIGPGSKAGGPNYLLGFGRWADAPVRDTGPGNPSAGSAQMAGDTDVDASLEAAAQAAVQADLSHAQVTWLRGALASDVRAWDEHYRTPRDRTGLVSEANVLRYLPRPVTVRLEGQHWLELLRVVAAGVRAGSALRVSTAQPLPEPIAAYCAQAQVPVQVRDETGWCQQARELVAGCGRVRLIGASQASLMQELQGAPALAVYDGPVVSSGRIELLTFLAEQAVSMTTHRFGTPRPAPLVSAALAGSEV